MYRLVTKNTSAGTGYISRETPDRTQDKNTFVTVGAYGSDSDARNGTRSSEFASSSAVCRQDKLAAVSVVA